MIKIEYSTNKHLLSKAHETDSGFDMKASLENSSNIEPGELKLISTGIRLNLPKGYEAQIRPRSGLALKGLTIMNTPGTIDQGYRGIIKIILINLGKEKIEIKDGDKIAQLVIKEVPLIKLKLIEEIELNTERSEKGFGSSGI